MKVDLHLAKHYAICDTVKIVSAGPIDSHKIVAEFIDMETSVGGAVFTHSNRCLCVNGWEVSGGVMPQHSDTLVCDTCLMNMQTLCALKKSNPFASAVLLIDGPSYAFARGVVSH